MKLFFTIENTAWTIWIIILLPHEEQKVARKHFVEIIPESSLQTYGRRRILPPSDGWKTILTSLILCAWKYKVCWKYQTFLTRMVTHANPKIWKNQLFSFWGLLKIFLTWKNFMWQWKPDFRGVILMKLFDPSKSFKAIQDQKWLFWYFQLINNCLDQKVLEGWPPKVRISNAK